MKSEEFLNEKSVARARKAAQAAQMAKKSAPTVKPPANLSTAPTVPTAQQPQQPAPQPAVFKSNRTAQQPQPAAQQPQPAAQPAQPAAQSAAPQRPKRQRPVQPAVQPGNSAIDALSQEYDQQRMAKPTVPTTSEPGAFSKSVANGINVGSNMLKGITQAIQQHSPHTGSFYQPTQVVKTPAPISTQNAGTTIAPARGTTPAALNQAVAAAQGKVAKQSTGTPEIDNMLRAMGKLNEGKNASN